MRPQTRLSSAERMLYTHSPSNTPNRIGGNESSIQWTIQASRPFVFNTKLRFVVSKKTPASAYSVSRCSFARESFASTLSIHGRESGIGIVPPMTYARLGVNFLNGFDIRRCTPAGDG